MNIFCKNLKNINLTNNDYLSSGGEADIYVKNGHAFKIYHDNNKIININKINELNKINDSNVIIPIEEIYNKSSSIIGYYMKYINNTYPLCKLFTKTFKNNNNITFEQINKLINQMRNTVLNIHDKKCIIGDFNEMNILINNKFDIPYFIDVDSYQTSSYKCTAIMDSIRDRTVNFGEFNINTDWFAFAILTFQLYIGIHPYKGKHPKYKINQWQKRMDDNISVFDTNVKLPNVCENLNVIPKKLLDWYKHIFIKNKRCEPPDIESAEPFIIPNEFVIIKGNNTFDINKIKSYNNNISYYENNYGINYIFTYNNIYKNNDIIYTNINNDKFGLVSQGDFDIITELKNNTLKLSNNNLKIAEMYCKDYMITENKLYHIFDNSLYLNKFIKLKSNNILHSTTKIANVLENSSNVYNGFIHQRLFNCNWIYIPIDNKCIYGKIDEIDNHNIISGKFKKNVCILITEYKGIYYKHILLFKDLNQFKYEILTNKNISDIDINFTVLNNGIVINCVNDKIQLFKDFNTIKEISNEVINSTTKLYSYNNKVYFTDNKILYTFKLK